MDQLKYESWLRNNTNLREGSIRLYARTISAFHDQYDQLSVENINDYVAKSFRSKHSFYVKYAFRQYLIYIKKPGLYKQIIPVKMGPRKKFGKYLKESLIRKIILNIKKEKYKDIALLQYATGARAREIITLKEENIDLLFSPDVIRIRLEGKGGKERVTFLSQKLRIYVEKYLKGQGGFLFLPAELNNADDQELETTINTQRTYFYNSLKVSAQSLGLDSFGTHDFRRNVAELIRKKHKDPFLVKKVLGHASINTTLRYFSDSPEDVEAAITTHQEEDLTHDYD